ncbi:MAG: alpha/beta hydrolase-fold protein [Syntrophobacteraceae bacterium]|nr:dienelactone hydrolase family protein [Desulfobacteraceae bacterium]
MKDAAYKPVYRYAAYLPSEYARWQGWPLILYLHGEEERGDDLEMLKTRGLPSLLEDRLDFPFVVVSPQCPAGEEWSSERLGWLLDDVMVKFWVDPDRIYVTGVGMGGYAAWRLGIEHPERFAAIAPVSGGGNPQEVCNMRDVPVWAFHGVWDGDVPVSELQSVTLALRLCGGNVRSTLYPEEGHECWREAYNDPELYRWFLEHDRSVYREPTLDPVMEDLD